MKPIPVTLNTPEAYLSSLWKRIPAYIKLIFASAVVLGLATHLYVFTNKFTNHDDLDQMFFASYGTQSGRWLLPLALRMDGEFSMPWLIGILSILCLAGVACFTAAVFRIRRPFGCIAAAAVVTAFPTAASTFAYMFTAYSYFLGLLLAAFGAYAAVRWGWPDTALGAVSITLSLGIYQSYFPVAAVMLVGALLLDVLDGDRPFKALFLRGLRYVATLAASMAAYMVLVRITTRDMGLTGYHGISSMGQISLKDVPKLICKGYGKCLSFFLKNDLGWHFSFLKFGFAAIVLCCVALAVLLLRKRKLATAQIALAAALVAVYPLAGALIYVMVPSGYVHGVMIYGFAYMLILPIALVDYAEDHLKAGDGLQIQAAAAWIILLTVSVTAYSYAVTDNNAYLKADLGMRQCAAYSNRMIERAESCEGYRPGMDLVLLGSITEDPWLSPTPELDSIDVTGILDLRNLRTSWTYDRFLRYYLGYVGNIYTSFHEQSYPYGAMDEVKAMPCYPADGSVRVVGDAVVVKLN